MTPHHWTFAGQKSRRGLPSPWGWNEFERILKHRLAPSTRQSLEKRCSDMRLRERVVEIVKAKMQGEERGYSEYIWSAYGVAEAEANRGPVEVTPEIAQEAASELVEFALSRGAKPLPSDSYKPVLDWTVLRGYPTWLTSYPWLSDYVIYYRSKSEIPIDYLIFCGLSILLVALGNAVRIEAWGVENTVNLYSLLAGPAGAAHKSTAIRQARDLLMNALPDVLQSDGFSQAAMEMSLAGDKASGLLVMDEFHSFLTGGNQSHKDDSRRFLMTLHNTNMIRTQYRSRGNTNIKYPALTLLGGMTEEQFWDDSDKGLFSGGLFSRLITLWDLSIGEMAFQLPRQELDEAQYQLRRHLERLGTGVETIVMLEDGDLTSIGVWAKEQRKDALCYGGAPITVRAAIHAMRIAVGLWASQRRPSPRTNIPSSCLNVAKELLERIYFITQEHLEQGMAKGPEGRSMLDVLNLLRENGGKMTYHDIAKEIQLFDNKIDRILATLDRRREITRASETIDGVVGSEEIEVVRLREEGT